MSQISNVISKIELPGDAPQWMVELSRAAVGQDRKQFINDLASLITSLEQSARHQAIEEARALCAEFNLTAEDLTSAPAKRRAERPPKFTDPASGKTWSGRGRRPTWYAAAQPIAA